MTTEIDIPENVLVHCPKVRFNLARMANCSTCPSFAGLSDRFPGSDMPFAQRYLVLCSAEPVKRELSELAE